MLETLNQFDQQFFLYLNNLHNASCDYIMYWISSTLFWIPLYLLLFALLQHIYTIKSCLLPILVLILCDQLSSSFIKPFVQRLRPCYDPQIQHLVHTIGDSIDFYGFPSSHATNTFGIAMIFWLCLRDHFPWMHLLFFWAFFVSYSRIYGGRHYPIDILAGALLGICIGWIIYRFLLPTDFLEKKKNICTPP